jgi:ubiquinone/menaquinone biosynthesis C-methylase UbiE
MDTISLARRGARSTGIDLSGKAITQARQLAHKTGVTARFIESDVYSLPEKLDETFDIVFTSYGVVGWLPDTARWAEIVRRYLNPGGRFVMVEFHPVLWMFDDDFRSIQYRYSSSAPIVEEVKGTYTDREADLLNRSVSWNHGLADVINALIKQGLTVSDFREYDYSPYSCFENVTEQAPGKFRIKGLEGKLPMLYSVVATNSRRFSLCRRVFVSDRDSPTEETRMAALSFTGQMCSQAPQPVHRSARMTGLLSVRGSPSTSTSITDRVMALGETGQNSSQTIHGVSIAHGRQRPLSTKAVPIFNGPPSFPVFSAWVTALMAPVGQTWPQRVQVGSQ